MELLLGVTEAALDREAAEVLDRLSGVVDEAVDIVGMRDC